MMEGICLINVGVVVDEIFVARVVRRIDVNEVNLAAMCFLQELKRGEVVSLYKEI